MKRIKKIISALVVAFMIFISPCCSISATQDKTANFNKNYNLTGNQASDIVAVAKAQLEKNKGTLGYTEGWCADFVYNCAKLANIPSSIIPYTGGVGEMYNGIINKGGKVTTSPVAGDICFYKNSSGSWTHVSIVSDNKKIQFMAMCLGVQQAEVAEVMYVLGKLAY